MAKVVRIDDFKQGKNKSGTGRATCDFHSVSDRTGEPIHGIAAMLHIMKQHGGPDQFLHKAVERGVKSTLREMASEVSRTNPLKRVS